MTPYRNRVFPLLSGLLWVSFLFLDITKLSDSTWVKFASVCLCCITALLGAHTADGKLVAAALCFTVGADWFLLVKNDHYTLGILLFLTVQLIYAYRLHLIRGNTSSPFFCRLALSCLGAGLSLFPLWCAAIYFINLCVNTLEAFTLKKHVFAWGLLLFVCCDVCVGAWNLGLFPGFTRIGMWLFYLPSQVLIVLSQESERRSFDEKAV